MYGRPSSVGGTGCCALAGLDNHVGLARSAAKGAGVPWNNICLHSEKLASTLGKTSRRNESGNGGKKAYNPAAAFPGRDGSMVARQPEVADTRPRITSLRQAVSSVMRASGRG